MHEDIYRSLSDVWNEITRLEHLLEEKKIITFEERVKLNNGD